MNLKTLWKDTFREITKTKARFLSILLIILLGVSIYAGVSAAGPVMLNSSRQYYDEQNLMDHQIIGSLGMTTEDIEALDAEVEGTVQPHHMSDVLLSDSNLSMRFYSYPSTGEQKINEYVVTEGRLPETSGEIALDDLESIRNQYSIGDTVEIETENVSYNSSDNFTTTTFKVVGFVNSPQYIDRVNRGQSSVGNGTLDGFAMIPEEDFATEVYTTAFIKYSDAENLQAYTEEYEAIVTDKTEPLEGFLNARGKERSIKLRDSITSEIETGEAQIQTAREELEAGEQALNESRQQLETAGLLAIPIEQLPPQLQTQVATFQEAEMNFHEQAAAAEEKIATGEVELDEARAQLDELPTGEFYIFDRTFNPGYAEYESNADRITAIARVFPVFFFLVAILVTLTTMTRMVDEGRTYIGTMKSLGYGNSHIVIKYVFYAFLAGLFGLILGLILGYWLFPTIVFNAYGAMYNFTEVHLQTYPLFTLISFIAVFLATVGSTLFALWPSVKKRPAQLLQKEAPKEGQHIFLERIPGLWSRLNYYYKITFRNLFRYKKRMWMTIIGIAGCTGLMLMGFGISDSVNDIMDNQFGIINQYDAIVSLDDEVNEEEKNTYNDTVSQLEEIDERLAIHQNTVDVPHTSEGIQTLTLTVPEDAKALSDYKLLESVETDEVLSVPDDGVLITQKISEMTEKQTGDTLEVLTSDNTTYELPIRGVVKNHLGHNAYLSPAVYETIFDEQPVTNVNWLKFERTAENETAISDAVMDLSYPNGLVFVSDIEASTEDSLGSLDLIVGVLIAAAALLAFVVLYNLTNVNVAERNRELATIKVLGFYDTEVSLYIFRENIFLTLGGILLGFVFGTFLHRFIIRTVEFSDMMFGRQIHWESFLVAALLTVLFSIIVMVVMHFKLKKTDMVEALSEE